jgi:hypothetical protein
LTSTPGPTPRPICLIGTARIDPSILTDSGAQIGLFGVQGGGGLGCGGPGGGAERAGDGEDHPRNRAALVNGERSSQLSTCLAASEVRLLQTARAKAVIDAQEEVIRRRWRDAAELTERERRQLFGREILNEYASRN